jgi:DnaJ homolog subfamily A member 2
VLEVVISPGMKNGQKISFHGEADEAPGIQPGSVIFVVQEKAHDVFKRKVMHNTAMLQFIYCTAVTGLARPLLHARMGSATGVARSSSEA